MSLKQSEAKFVLRIKIIDPQHRQPIDTDTRLIWTLSIAPVVYFFGQWPDTMTDQRNFLFGQVWFSDQSKQWEKNELILV